MKTGIALPQSAALGLRALRSFVDTAQGAGLDSLWVGDHLVFPPEVDRATYPYIKGMHGGAHLFSDRQWSESIVTLTAGAALSETMELGFGVLLPALRNPLILAKQLATMDALSGGRLIVGMGVGWLRQEYQALGVPFEERVERLVEQLEIMRLMWTGEPAGYQGRFWSFDQVIALPAPAQGKGLRVWYGGNHLGVLRRLAPAVEGWLPYEPSSADLSAGRAVASQARAAAGAEGPFTIAAVTRLPLAGDRELGPARSAVERYRAGGVEHLAVLSSMGRSAEDNRLRIERLKEVLDSG
jgi:probable F420-dependent oxidoreductase